MKVLSSLFCWLPKVADFSTWFLHLLPFSKKKESSLFLCTDSWCCYNKNRVKSKPSKEVTDLYQQQQEKIGIKTIYKCHGRGFLNNKEVFNMLLLYALCIKNRCQLYLEVTTPNHFLLFQYSNYMVLFRNSAV